MLLLMVQIVLGNSSTTSRINYGTIFEHKYQIYFSSEHWAHTYIFKLERPMELNPFWPACNCTNKTIPLHPDFKYVLYQLNALHNNTLAEIDNVISEIFELIPQHDFESRRKRRSLIPIIGRISKGLFGLATTEDVQKIANYINYAQKKQNKEIKGFTHEIDILHSFMSATDFRINNVIKGVKENNMMLMRINQDLHANFEKLQEKNSMIMSILVDQLQKSSYLSHSFANLKYGIYNLMRNQLTTNIIPYAVMAKTMNHIQVALNNKQPGFQLIFKDPHFYYLHNTFSFYRQDNKIMITMKFPIGKIHKPMSLLKIHSYPVPLNETSNHATAILNMPSYLAVSQDHSFYTEVTEDALQKCNIYNKIAFCEFNIALTTSNFWKCSYALYKDNRAQIKASCEFRFFPNAISPMLKQLNQTHFLIHNISSLTLQCSNNTKTIVGCFFCIISLPCNCSVMTLQYYLPERWDGCHHKHQEISKVHPVNLALLQEYFSDKQLKHITSQTTFHRPLNVSIPPFKIYENNLSEIIANDKMAHLSLKRMINMSKKNQMFFASLADSMFSETSYNTEGFPVDLALSILATVIASLAFGLLLILFRKYKYISIALASHQLLPKSKAFPTLPAFHYTTPPDEVVTFNYHTLTISDIAESSNIYLAAVVIIFCIALFMRQLLMKKFFTTLVLDITDGTSCIQMNVQKLPSNIVSCHFKGSHVLTEISLTNGFIPTVTINWGDLSLTNTLLKHEVELKTILRLNPYKAYKLKRMLKNKFSMFIWVNHNNTSVPITICKPPCNDCIPKHAISANTTIKAISETPLLTK